VAQARVLLAQAGFSAAIQETTEGFEILKSEFIGFDMSKFVSKFSEIKGEDKKVDRIDKS